MLLLTVPCSLLGLRFVVHDKRDEKERKRSHGGADILRGRGLHRVQTQRGQDGGEALPRMTDSSIGRLYRTTFCALKHTCSSHYPAIYLDSGLSFDASL